MLKTQSGVEQDFYNALKKTSLAKQVNGDVYKADIRPTDSKNEDVIIRVTTLDADQYQSGAVTVIVYVPDVSVVGYARPLPNKARLAEIEEICSTTLRDELSGILTDYNNLRLETSIGSYNDSAIEQHYVSTKLLFDYLTI